MRVPIRQFGWALLAMFYCSIVSCAGGLSTPAQFYMLNPVAQTAGGRTGAAEPETVRVSLEPVEIPQYLNRPQIVTHMDGAVYHVDEFNQWLEPLGDNLTRVIGENLSEMLGADGIDILTAGQAMRTDLRIAVQILRLDGHRGRQAVMAARWSIFDRTEGSLVLTRRSFNEEPVGDDSFHSFVTAQNRMVELLSREIADAVRPVVLK